MDTHPRLRCGLVESQERRGSGRGGHESGAESYLSPGPGQPFSPEEIAPPCSLQATNTATPRLHPEWYKGKTNLNSP